MPKRKGDKSLRLWTRACIVIGLVVLLTSGSLWFTHNKNKPENVFWQAIANSLVTPSITRHVTESGGGQNLDQYTQIELGPQPISRDLRTISDASGSGQAVTTENIGTPTTDYVRYLSIKTSQKSKQGTALDFSKLLNVWSKSDNSPASAQPVSNFKQAFFGSVPFVNLPSSLQKETLNLIQQKKIYEPDFNSVKQTTVNGRRVYQYDVSLNLEQYVIMLQRLLAISGLGADSGLNPANYQGQAPAKLIIYIDVTSQQVARVMYHGSSRQEDYLSPGLHVNTVLPSDTISVNELQNRVQTLQDQ